jgi:hypothetical protein
MKSPRTWRRYAMLVDCPECRARAGERCFASTKEHRSNKALRRRACHLVRHAYAIQEKGAPIAYD